MTGLSAYPKIWSITAPEVRDNLFNGGVEITEKIDGSAIGFGLDETGILHIRSKGSIIYSNNNFIRQPDKLFKAAVEYIISIKDKLHAETTYYGEVLSSKRHNNITYGSVPRNNIVLYGIQTRNVWADDHEILTKEADALGLDSVPLVYSRVVCDKKQLFDMLNQISYYGEAKIEGVVIKNFNQVANSPFSTACFGKLVSDEYKESSKSVKSGKLSTTEEFYKGLTNSNRWDKAIQHLRDDGKLTDSSKDIGVLIEEIVSDFETEQKETVKEQLYYLNIKNIRRYVVEGFPQYYKEKLNQLVTINEK